MGVYRIQRLLVTHLSLLQERLGRFILLLGDKLLCINCIDCIDCIDPIGMWEYISWILSHLLFSPSHRIDTHHSPFIHHTPISVHYALSKQRQKYWTYSVFPLPSM